MTDKPSLKDLIPSGLVRITPVETPRPVDMRALYQAGGWWEDAWDDYYLAAIVENSYAFVAAEIPDGSWVGMGRLISDGVSDAYLQDIVVLPEWEGQGIGSALVQTLLDICTERGIIWIGTIAQPQTEYFYRRFGFAKMNAYTPMRYEK
ncbi:MAG: N-acetyltransferase [Methanomicrobiales archaeon HGW-Methanomicrobiales-4]|nr:MAG: N-acetyltransferase [Methanomicrobiales archaeon HGW-Methanomicrobiales-4]